MLLPVPSTAVSRTRYVRGFRFDAAAQVIVCSPRPNLCGHRVERLGALTVRVTSIVTVAASRRRNEMFALLTEAVAVRADRREQRVVAGERRAAVVGVQVVAAAAGECRSAAAWSRARSSGRRGGRRSLPSGTRRPRMRPSQPIASVRRRAGAKDPADRSSTGRDEPNADLPFERELRRHTQRRSERGEVLRNDGQRRRLCVRGDDECRRDDESQPAHRGRVAVAQDCRLVWVGVPDTLFLRAAPQNIDVVRPDRRPAAGDRGARERAAGGRALSDAARRDRHREDRDDGVDHRAGAAARRS